MSPAIAPAAEAYAASLRLSVAPMMDRGDCSKSSRRISTLHRSPVFL
jgi:hypothetical protein